MKKYLLVFFMLSYSVLSFVDSEISFAQWQPDLRLTYDTGICLISLNGARGITAYANFVHIAWCDERDGNREIYYKRSTNFGATWGQDIRFTNNPASSYRPSIAVFGPLVHVVWCDARDGNFEIYYKRSTDNGSNWSPDIRITNTPNISWAPSMAVNGSILHIVWEEVIEGNEEIFYKCSTNDGISWGTDVNLSADSCGSFYPSIAVYGSSLHVVWYDFTIGNRSVFYKHSLDGGITWSQNIKLTSVSAQSYNPSVAVSNQTVHVVWHDTRYGNEEVFYIRSSDGGTNWGAETRLTDNPGISYYPSICVSGPSVHIAWYDNSFGNYEICYGLSTDDGLSWQPNTRLTYDTADSYRPSIAVLDTIVHVIWNDYRDGDWEMYYKRKFINTINVKNISSEIPGEYRLHQNYPNPFNPVTNIKFEVMNLSDVKITIYDLTGKEIDLPVNERLKPGAYEIRWDASKYPSGVYFCRLNAGNYQDTKRMIFVK